MLYPAKFSIFSSGNRKSYSEIDKPSCSQRLWCVMDRERGMDLWEQLWQGCQRYLLTPLWYCPSICLIPFGTSSCPEIPCDSKCQKSTTLCLNKCFLKFVLGWYSIIYKFSYYKIEGTEILLLPYPEFSWQCHFSSPPSPFTSEDSQSFLSLHIMYCWIPYYFVPIRATCFIQNAKTFFNFLRASHQLCDSAAILAKRKLKFFILSIW